MTVAFTETDLERAADGRSYERGLGYVDHVDDLEFSGDGITAVVYGGADYRVSLMLDDDGVAGECSCPYGLEGNFCKHCVAVGLVVLREGDNLRSLQAAARDRKRGLDEWLASLAREDLLDLLREQIAEDRQLRRRLELRAASANSDVAALRAASGI
ncbi:MAG TPA: SWIM zinc finger family protein [Micromonospora sp.]|nr:SWIM zinc finger family protein [Micromonospora sp.]